MKYQGAKHLHSFTRLHVRIVSMLLSLLLLFSFVPPISLAAESETTQGASVSEPAVKTTDNATYTEIVERRDQFTKHFKRNDGKIVAIVYPEAIHTVENGVMVNLDNRLTKSVSGRFENADQDFHASFAASAAEPDAIRLMFEGYTLSWRVDIVRKEYAEEKWQGVLSDATQAFATVSPTVEAPRAASVGTVKAVAIADADERTSFTEEEIKSTFMANSGMTYYRAFSGNSTVDLVYSLSDHKLEEDILIWDKGDIHSYVLTMHASGMTAVLGDDRSVIFLDANKNTVFTISSPWMHDAAYAFSDNINVSLVQKGNEVTVVYTPDAEWMSASERVYPVLIDPSVRSRNYTSNYQDTFTYSGNTIDRSTMTYMRVGSGRESYLKLLHYPMALDAVEIESATLNFWGSANSTNLRMRVLTTPWDQSTLTYDNRPLGLSTVYTATTAATSNGWRVFDLMPAINTYEYDHQGQAGFFTDYLEGFRVYHDSTTTQYLLISSESTDSQTRPYIEITYSYQYDNPIMEQGIYMIKNAASGRSVMNTSSATNVYQYSSAYFQGQAFRARGANGVFTFESMMRTGEALTYEYSGSNTQNISNVYTAALSDTLADSQEFMLQYVEDSSQGYQLYAIVSRADTTMALTAIGTANGSPTRTGISGTGNIVMSPYVGSTNQLWYFESGGQPVFVGNNIVAMDGDTLQFNYGVLVSYVQPYAYVTAYGERIVWSSDNTDAITVASNGKVTVNGAGKATITATIQNSSGTVLREYSYTVIISLGNGLYRIKNKATGLYLGIDGTIYTSNTDIVLTEFISSGIEQYGQYWKIREIGDGKYSIRLFPQQNLAMSNSNPVDIYNIGVNDTGTSVPNHAKWSFYWEGGDNYQIYVNNSSSNGLTASNGSVISSAYIGADTQLWEFEPIYLSEGLHILTEHEGVHVGGTLQFSAEMYFLNNPNIYGDSVVWSVVNQTGYATIDPSTGILSGILPGNVVVVATYSSSSGQWSDFHTITVQERYLYELVHTFGFSPDEAALIRSIYDKVDTAFPNEPQIHRDWMCSRLLGGLVYNYISEFKWNDVAGSLFENQSNYAEAEQEYFVDTLGYTEEEYIVLRSAVQEQYSNTNNSDFAHFQISFSARLAYSLHMDGVLSNIGTFCSNEEVSYLAGWLGDATLIDDGTTYFANDDYCADLDAENIYRLILQEYSFLNAFSAYYCSFNDTVNRATTFLSYISYEYVQNKVFTRLVPGETAPWNIIQSRYPDTYNFLLSLQDTLHEMGDYQ